LVIFCFADWQSAGARGLPIRDTADCQSALRGLRLRRAVLYRRFVIRNPPRQLQPRAMNATVCRLQVGDTADYKSVYDDGRGLNDTATAKRRRMSMSVDQRRRHRGGYGDAHHGSHAFPVAL